MKVLLVEDEVHVRRALARSLEAWGHTVTKAETAASARAALGTTEFDLMILDAISRIRWVG